jgi:hypothetical protein
VWALTSVPGHSAVEHGHTFEHTGGGIFESPTTNVPSVCTLHRSFPLQLQEAVQQLQLPKAPHVVAPICEAGSSSMALRYWDKITEQQQALTSQAVSGTTAAGSSAQQPGSMAVLKPEFLIFRNITSAVVAQVRSWRLEGSCIMAPIGRGTLADGDLSAYMQLFLTSRKAAAVLGQFHGCVRHV